MTRILDYLTSSYFLLSNRPSGVGQNPPCELVELVKTKVLEQDQRYRKALGYFKKLGINASSIALVFRDKDVETVCATPSYHACLQLIMQFVVYSITHYPPS